MSIRDRILHLLGREVFEEHPLSLQPLGSGLLCDPSIRQGRLDQRNLIRIFGVAQVLHLGI